MKIRLLCMLVLIAAIVFLITSGPASALAVGDKAPPLIVSKWFNGTQVNPDKPDGKTVYVIEFWATWCGPCKKTIPHLIELQNQYKDKNVIVVGITNEEEKVVTPFIGEMKMTYRVGIDDGDKTSSVYMKGIEGIPHSFIVNRDGIIIWSGHPLSGLDDVLPKVIAGTYSIEDVKKKELLQANLQKALDEQNIDKSITACDEMMKEDPANQKAMLVKLKLLSIKGDSQALRSARLDAVKRFSKNPEMLDRIAYDAMSCDNVQMRDMLLAYEVVQQGIVLTEKKSSELFVTLAMIYKELDMLDESIAALKDAIKCEKDEDSRKELDTRIKYFEMLNKAREEVMKKK
ncbi:MAG: redoxin family protein [Candidatus Xenobiia bacterium LiM19]